MVKIINKSVCRGVAGRRANAVPYGIVIHNTADNNTAEQHMNRLASYNNKQLEAGFAHYFIDENTIVRTEDTYNMAWHTANADGNANYVGYEVCRSTGDEKKFLQAEQNTFMQAAQDFKEWGKVPTRENVRLHKEFVATACPHKSWDLHGKSVNAVKDYYISQIKKYMAGNKPNPPVNKPKPPVKPRHNVRTYWFEPNSPSLKKVLDYNKAKKYNHKQTKAADGRIMVETFWFNQDSPGKDDLIKFYEKNYWSYDIQIEKK